MDNYLKLELLRISMQIEQDNPVKSKEIIIETYKELVSLMEENSPK